jgi:plastocyanin
MISVRIAVVSGVLLSAMACADTGSSTSPTAATDASSTSITIPMSAATLGNRAFNPDELNLAAGATVTWTNGDSESHTSTSDSRGWDSGAVLPGGHFSVQFPNAGTFQYHCAIHPDMVGTIVVR